MAASSRGIPATSPKLQAYRLLGATADWSRAQAPREQTELEWINYGTALGRVERLIPWEIGDWYLRGEKWGNREKIINDPEWLGPSLKTCQNYASVAAAFPHSRRRESLSFSLHAELARFAPEDADRRLLQIEGRALETGEPPPRQQIRQELKRERRETRERELGDAIRNTKIDMEGKYYGVLLADPPWRFEPWSTASGMDRAADNHYPTMTTEEICQLDVPAAGNAVLFLWRTAPMLIPALKVMSAWGFEYRTEIIWAKNRLGTGYWTRNQHEVLMIGVQGSVPAPSPGLQPSSLQVFDVGAHSEKPAGFYDIIESMFPTVPRVELFARQARDGWDRWGAEANRGISDPT